MFLLYKPIFGQPFPASFKECLIFWGGFIRLILIVTNISVLSLFTHQTLMASLPLPLPSWLAITEIPPVPQILHALFTSPCTCCYRCLTSLSPPRFLCIHIFSFNNSNQTWVIMCRLYCDWHCNSECMIQKQKCFYHSPGISLLRM